MGGMIAFIILALVMVPVLFVGAAMACWIVGAGKILTVVMPRKAR